MDRGPVCGQSGARPDVRARSATARRCGRCCLRRRHGRRSTWESFSESSLLLSVTELFVTPLVAFCFHAPLFARPVHMVGVAGPGHAGVLVGRDSLRRDAGPGAQSRRAAADPVVSDYRSGHHCRRISGRRRWCSRPQTSRWPLLWIAMLMFFDVVFVTLALWMFEPLMIE